MYEKIANVFLESDFPSFYISDSIKIENSLINPDRYYCGVSLSSDPLFYKNVKDTIRKISSNASLIELVGSLCEDRTIDQFYLGSSIIQESLFYRAYFGKAQQEKDSANVKSATGYGFEWCNKDHEKLKIKQYDYFGEKTIEPVLLRMKGFKVPDTILKTIEGVFLKNEDASVLNALTSRCREAGRQSVDFKISGNIPMSDFLKYSKQISKFFYISESDLVAQLSKDCNVDRLQVSSYPGNKFSLGFYFGGRTVYNSNKSYKKGMLKNGKKRDRRFSANKNAANRKLQ